MRTVLDVNNLHAAWYSGLLMHQDADTEFRLRKIMVRALEYVGALEQGSFNSVPSDMPIGDEASSLYEEFVRDYGKI